MSTVVMPVDRLATPGAIARATGHPRDRVVYVIRKLGVQPEARAGQLRVFSEGDVQQIAQELDAIGAKRDARETQAVGAR